MEDRTGRKKIRWGFILLAAVILAAGSFIFYYVSIAKKTLDEITDSDGVTSVYSVFVMEEDPADSFQDIRDYVLGISTHKAAFAETKKAAKELEDLLEREIKVTEYKELFSLADGLKQQEVQAVLLDEAYLPGIFETEGYQWMENGIRRIHSFEWEQETAEPDDVMQDVPRQLPETFIMYISGIDTYGNVAARSRSDVNILAAVNTKTHKIQMIATPRDFYVDFAVTGGSMDKLTHAGIYGVDQSVDALEGLYGISVDYFVRLNFSGFVDVIDALGGIDVYSEYEFSVADIRTYQKGMNSLTGLEALAFARERYSFARGDYQRAANQMEVIRAVMTKLASPAILKNYRSVMKALAGSIETNMPEKHITDLVKLQLFEKPGWEIRSFTTQGSDSNEVTYSMPGQKLYVIIPNTDSVEEAKEKIREVL